MKSQRTAIVIALTLMPWPAVWFGMYHLRSLVWTFVLYHAVCLLPACIWGRNLWLPHVLKPSGRQWATVIVATVLTCAVGVLAYTYSGELIVSRRHVMEVLTERGFQASQLLPLAIYFVVVNSILEELFWRGTVLNELEYVDKATRFGGTAWTAVAFAAWHWLVLRALLQPGYAELAVVGVVAVGAWCSFIYKKTQSIVVAILWHGLVFDLAIIAMFVVLVRASSQ